MWPADVRSNQIIVGGPQGLAAAAEEFLKKLDEPDSAVLKVYRFQSVSPEQADRLFKSLLGQGGNKQAYRSGIDNTSGTLAVLAPQDMHDQLTSLVQQVDVPAQQSPIQFYKLKNTVAADVLDTIAGLQDESGEGGGLEGAMPGGEEGATADSTSAGQGAVAGGTGAPRAASVQQPPPGAAVPPSARRGPPAPQDNMYGSSGVSANGNLSYMETGTGLPGRTTSDQAARTRISPVRTSNATITADANTNSIIVMASPSVQKIYEELINRLDQRRAQVLVECTIVTLDTTDNFRLGVELSGDVDLFGYNRILGLSSFGLSGVTADGTLEPFSQKHPAAAPRRS